MATSPTTIEQILARVGVEPEVSARKMFGEYGLFVDGKMVALVCDDILYLKPTPRGLEILGEHESEPPYPGAKPCPIIPDRFRDQPGRLAKLLAATAEALPAPKPKKPKPTKSKTPPAP